MNTLQIYDYFDAHTHFQPDYSSRIFAIQSFRAGIQVPDAPFYSIGIHPYDAQNPNCHNIDPATLAHDNPRVVAIGEIGLDFRFTESVPMQIQLFKNQLLTAQLYSLPVVIHCVKATEQTLAILQQADCRDFMFHGFNGSINNAKKVLSAGGFLSFGANLLTNTNLQEVFRQVAQSDITKILLESDEVEGVIPQLYDRGAELISATQQSFMLQIKQNFTTFYNL